MDGTLKYFGFTTLTNSADQFNFSDTTVLVWKRFHYCTHWPKTSWGVFFEEHHVIDSQVGRGFSPFIQRLWIREVIRFPACPELFAQIAHSTPSHLTIATHVFARHLIYIWNNCFPQRHEMLLTQRDRVVWILRKFSVRCAIHDCGCFWWPDLFAVCLERKWMLSEHLQGVRIWSIRKQSLPKIIKFICAPTDGYRARLRLHEGYLSVNGGPQSSPKTTWRLSERRWRTSELA